MKILIVDDEAPARDYIAYCVKKAGETFDLFGVAESGKKALEILSKNKIDLVLLDVTMPKMSGLEVLETIKHDYPNTDVVMLTCHDDFNYARSAMKLKASDYILKSELDEKKMKVFLEEYLSHFQKKNLSSNFTEQVQRSHYLKDVMQKEDVIVENSEHLEKNKIFLEETDFFVMAFDISEKNIETVKEMMPKWFFNPLLLTYSQETIILITNIKSDHSKSKIQTQFNQFKAVINRSLEDDVGFSDVYYRLVSIKRAVMQAVEDKESLFYKVSGNFNFVTDKTEIDEIQKEMQILSAEAIFALRDGDIQEYSLKLLDYLDAALKIKFFDVATLKKNLSYIVSVYDNYDEHNVADECEMEIGRVKNFDELKNLINNFLSKIKKNSSYYSDTIDTTIKYIKDNYREDVMLTDVAQKLHFNSEYLSRQFKKEVGVNFSEYLTALRMREAKRLLLNTKMKIGDISFEVGINNQGYFSSMFSKFYGISPNNLRKGQKSD